MSRAFMYIILLFPATLQAQHYDSLLTTFYTRTLNYYFADTTYRNAEKKFSPVLVRADFNHTALPLTIQGFKFRYIDSSTPIRSVLLKPLKRNVGRPIYQIYHNLIHPDTIDINITGLTVEKVGNKMIGFATWCGGTMGYIPEGRFVFDHTTNSWTFTSGKAFMDHRMEELKQNLDLIRQKQRND